MTVFTPRAWIAAGTLLAGLACAAPPAAAGPASMSIEERLAKLEQRQTQLEETLRARDARIKELEDKLATDAPTEVAAAAPAVPALAPVETRPEPALSAALTQEIEQAKPVLDTSAPLVPGRGFTVADTDSGSLNISAYGLFRGTLQTPSKQTFLDHLGRERSVDTRRDVQLHRVMLHFKGWVYDPKFRYQLTAWTVNDTEQVRIIGALNYKFADWFTLSGGIGPMPGTRTMMGSHPLWYGHDRVMADEFFRTGFTFGIWGSGQITPTIGYHATIGNNISTLGVNASEDTRDFAYGASVWWMPTTGEFGPQGGMGDFEYHEEMATRFGFSTASSPKEDRTAQPDVNSPDSTQIRLGDSLLLFEHNALGNGITVQTANFNLMSLDAGFKYRGFALHAEGYYRTLDNFRATALSLPIPVSSIDDTGFYVQSSFFPIKHYLELYASTSHVFADEDVGYTDSSEYILGANWYWSRTRYQRLNMQLINVDSSPTSSTFGYYQGGMEGLTFTVDASFLY